MKKWLKVTIASLAVAGGVVHLVKPFGFDVLNLVAGIPYAQDVVLVGAGAAGVFVGLKELGLLK